MSLQFSIAQVPRELGSLPHIVQISPSDRPERKFRFQISLSALKYGVAAVVGVAAAAGVGSKRACAGDRWTVNDSEFLSVSFKTLSARATRPITDGIDGFGIR